MNKYAQELGVDFTLELRGFQYRAKDSKGTACWSGAVMYNGELLGPASNLGHGGRTLWLVNDRAAHLRLQAWAETLPTVPANQEGPAFKPTLEWVLDRIVEAYVECRALRRLMKRTGECSFLMQELDGSYCRAHAPVAALTALATNPRVFGIVSPFGASFEYDIWHNITLPIIWQQTRPKRLQ